MTQTETSNNNYAFIAYTVVTKAAGYVNQEKIRIHNYAKIQHMLKY